MDGGVEKGDLFFAIVAAAVLLALEIFSGLSIDIDLCRGRVIELEHYSKCPDMMTVLTIVALGVDRLFLTFTNPSP